MPGKLDGRYLFAYNHTEHLETKHNKIIMLNLSNVLNHF